MGKKKNRNKGKKKATGQSPEFHNDQLGENSSEGRMERKSYEEYRDV